MLKVEKLCFTRKGKTDTFRLENIQFHLEKGYIMALLGLNGSGKSTLMNLLQGIYLPDSGSVTLDGLNVSKVPERSIG